MDYVFPPPPTHTPLMYHTGSNALQYESFECYLSEKYIISLASKITLLLLNFFMWCTCTYVEKTCIWWRVRLWIWNLPNAIFVPFVTFYFCPHFSILAFIPYLHAIFYFIEILLYKRSCMYGSVNILEEFFCFVLKWKRCPGLLRLVKIVGKKKNNNSCL